ncbi:MAG TPA: helix-turn-helix transcriptional regulator [Candidatus Angelobacter sp.]|jgi:DNA-binding CsgD family transcriptional regulator|nr:helix-turn-helix transcriptional regulator [Candidatus Angelobacter sp.]
MDQLLILPLKHGVPEDLLASLRQAGWRITVTSDLVRAKQLLQKREVAALILEINAAEHDPDRLKILRFVQEFCRGTLVILLHARGEAVTSTAQHQFVQSLNNVSDVRMEIQERAKFDLYQLSPAQKRIAEFVAQAYPNKEIARSLKIKEQSVRNELSRIFKKMGVWNRVELALLMRNGTPSQNHTNNGAKEPWATGSDTPPEPPTQEIAAPAYRQ